MRVDTLIRGAQLLDGTGRPPTLGADLGVRNGRIVAIAPEEPVDARETIDAEGLVVAPGFIDLHSHGDLVLAWPSDRRLGLLEGRLAQGITTEVVGNCGLGAAPIYGGSEDLLQQLNGWMSPAPFPWSWKSLADYLDHLERLGVPVNVAALVPHGPLRVGSMGLAEGDSAQHSRAAMDAALAGALEEGAFGFSCGLIYPPGMFTPTDELMFLAKRVARFGRIFASHIRGSSETLLPAVEELLRVGFETGVAVHHSHAEAVGRAHWDKLDVFLELEDKAWSEGIRVTRDMFPYPVAATMMLAIYPPWSLEGGIVRLLDRLRDPFERRRIERDIASVRPEWPPWRKGGWPHNLVRAVGWNRIRIASVGTERNRDFEGLSLQELGDKMGKSPFDAVSDLMLEEKGNMGQCVLDISGEEGLRRLISRPDVAFITDANDYGKGKPHPAAYGSFPRILGHFVRQEGLLDLSQAIRRMTSLPAAILGLNDRGILKEGYWADLVLLDPERIVDRATFEEPRQKAEGIAVVFVNGEIVYRNGALSGSLPGRVLRRGK